MEQRRVVSLGSIAHDVEGSLGEQAIQCIRRRQRAGLEMIRAGAAGLHYAGAVGERPLGAASYHLWSYGVTELLMMGADPRRSGLCTRNASLAVLLGAQDKLEAGEALAVTIRECAKCLRSLLTVDPYLLRGVRMRAADGRFLMSVRSAAESARDRQVVSEVSRLMMRSR